MNNPGVTILACSRCGDPNEPARDGGHAATQSSTASIPGRDWGTPVLGRRARVDLGPGADIQESAVVQVRHPGLVPPPPPPNLRRRWLELDLRDVTGGGQLDLEPHARLLRRAGVPAGQAQRRSRPPRRCGWRSASTSAAPAAARQRRFELGDRPGRLAAAPSRRARARRRPA